MGPDVLCCAVNRGHDYWPKKSVDHKFESPPSHHSRLASSVSNVSASHSKSPGIKSRSDLECFRSDTRQLLSPLSKEMVNCNEVMYRRDHTSPKLNSCKTTIMNIGFRAIWPPYIAAIACKFIFILGQVKCVN